MLAGRGTEKLARVRHSTDECSRLRNTHLWKEHDMST